MRGEAVTTALIVVAVIALIFGYVQIKTKAHDIDVTLECGDGRIIRIQTTQDEIRSIRKEACDAPEESKRRLEKPRDKKQAPVKKESPSAAPGHTSK